MPLPLKRAKKRGIFCLSKDEKKSIQLNRKGKKLKRKNQRCELLLKLSQEESKRKIEAQKAVETLKKKIQMEKEKMDLEGKSHTK